VLTQTPFVYFATQFRVTRGVPRDVTSRA